MSEARRHEGSGLKASYDKLALTVALVVLLASAVVLLILVQGKRSAITDPVWERATAKAPVEPVDLSTYSSNLVRVRNPNPFDPDDRMILVSQMRVSCVNPTCGRPIPYTALACPFCKATQPPLEEATMDRDGDTIPDKVEKAVGLNPVDPSDGAGDADKDGFSNSDEFVFDATGSAITNAAVKPPTWTRLRVDQVRMIPFKLRFVGISQLATGARYQLNLRTLDRTYFAEIGKTIEGFLVKSFDDKGAEGPTLILEQGGKEYRLPQGKTIETTAGAEWVARLVNLDDAKLPVVKVGERVVVKGETYKVVDIKEAAVVIRNENTATDGTIRKITDKERDALRGGQVSPAGPGEGGPGGLPGFFEGGAVMPAGGGA